MGRSVSEVRRGAECGCDGERRRCHFALFGSCLSVCVGFDCIREMKKRERIGKAKDKGYFGQYINAYYAVRSFIHIDEKKKL